MKAEGHLARANEIKGSVDKLKDDPVHLVAVVELCYGLAQQYIAYALEMKFGEHKDTHAGLPALLRENGQVEIAESFERLDTLRHGRWYGGKGNGEVLEEALEIIEEIERWAVG
jgi:hypothetical protein